MSSVGGGGGLFRRIAEGAQSALGRLAQWFRLGPYGAVEPPETPQPARPELHSVPEIVQEIARRQLVPAAQEVPRYSEFYICIASDADTGEVLARIPHQVEYDEGVARSTRYSRARRYALGRLPSYLPGEDVAMRNISWKCRVVRRTTIFTPA